MLIVLRAKWHPWQDLGVDRATLWVLVWGGQGHEPTGGGRPLTPCLHLARGAAAAARRQRRPWAGSSGERGAPLDRGPLRTGQLGERRLLARGNPPGVDELREVPVLQPLALQRGMPWWS